MSPGQEIDRLTPDHADEAAAVIRASFAEHEHKVDPPSAALDETAVSVLAGEGLIAVVDHAVVGCVLLRLHDDHAYLGRLGVLPTHRGRGLAEALVSGAESEALAQGKPEVRLGVRISLPGNRAFFEHLGYTVTGEGTHRGYDHPTFLWMAKPIGPQ